MESSIVSVVTLVVYAGVAVYMIVEPDVVGRAKGWVRGGYIDSPTPGGMVRFAGCAMLAVLPGAMVAFALNAWWAGVLVGLAVAIGLFVLANRLLPR